MLTASFSLTDLAIAQTEIHKCTDADGGIVYTEVPCAFEKSVKSNVVGDGEKTEPKEPISTESVSTKRELLSQENLQEDPDKEIHRAACKKRYRDAIDVIDAEIGKEFTPEKGEQYKKQLLILTSELRNC